MGLFDQVKDMAENLTGQDLDNFDLNAIKDKLPENITDIFDDGFMKANTSFDNIQDFFNEGGFKMDSLDDLKNIKEDVLNKFVGEKTNFGNWQEMLMNAASKFMGK